MANGHDEPKPSSGEEATPPQAGALEEAPPGPSALEEARREIRDEAQREEAQREEAQREEAQREGAQRVRRTEVRGTRLSESEADRLDRLAEKAGLSISTLIRVTCLSDERPDKKLLAAALQEIRNFVESLPHGPSAGEECALSAEDLSELRDRIDEICSGLIAPSEEP